MSSREALVQADEKVDGSHAGGPNGCEVVGEARRERVGPEERLELTELPVVVDERQMFRRLVDEEVERVVDRHLGDEIDLDAELADRLGERQPCDVVALRVLLPVHEVPIRFDAHRVRENRGAAMRRRTQTNELRRQRDGPIVAVVR